MSDVSTVADYGDGSRWKGLARVHLVDPPAP